LATLAENYPADFSNQKNEILDGEATPSSMQYKFKLSKQNLPPKKESKPLKKQKQTCKDF
jgi:hypothetical protein